MKGCVKTPVTCMDPGKYCQAPKCIAYQGCVNQSRECGANTTAACTFYSCNENKRECTQEVIVCGVAIDTTTVVLTSVLTTAALAGIIIAAVLIVGGIGGGTVLAVAQSGILGTGAVTTNNPLYAEDTTAGSNPLHRV